MQSQKIVEIPFPAASLDFMRRYIKLLAISVLLISGGFAAGTVFGFWNGLRASLLLESTPKGVLASANLKAIEEGKSESVKLLLESEVDQALSFYSLQKEAWWYPVFESGFLLVNPNNYEQYMRDVANYRKAHPNPIRDDMFDVVPGDKSEYKAEYKETAASIREYKKRIDDAVQTYADK